MSVKEIIRLDNWWCAKIPPLLAVAYVQVLRSGLGPSRAVLWLACFVFSIACVAAYGHVINDIFDREADRRAGKPNALARLGPGRAGLIAGALLVAGLVPATVVGYSSWAPALLVLNYLWPTIYSVPGVRLKERGLWGVLCDAAGSHITPTLFALALFAAPAAPGSPGLLPFPVLAVLWASVQGIKGILYHQVADRENDLAAGVTTFATVALPHRLERFLPRYNLGVELPISCLLVLSVFGCCPLAVVGLLVYCLVESVKYGLGFQFALHAQHRRASFPFVNEFFYVVWFPLAAAVQAALLSPAWLWLPVLHVFAFRTVFRTQAGDLRSVATALQQRLAHHLRSRRGATAPSATPVESHGGVPASSLE